MTEHRRRSLAGTAVLALVLVGGFYGAVLLLALAMIAAPVVAMLVLDDAHVGYVAAAVLGVALLWSVIPKREHFRPPGPRIEREDQPELWNLIEKVAGVANQKVPTEIYLLDEMNAYVADLGGVLGVGGRRVMGLGVPLMRVVDPEEFGAIIAHEFGHLRGGATRFGPLVYRIRSAVARTLEASRGSMLRVPYVRFARLFLRATRAVAEAQELSADALAAKATSVRAAAGALARLPFGTVAYAVYQRDEFLPILRSGHRPPFLEGFDTFLMSAIAQEHLDLEPGAALGSTARSDHDSHPPVADRLRALGADAADLRDRPLPTVPAIGLLRDTDAIEDRLVAGHVESGTELVPIPWEEVGAKVLVPAWSRERASLLGDLPPGFHLGVMPVDADGLAELGDDVGRALGRSLTRTEREAYGHHVARAIIGEVAAAHGLTVEMTPGQPVWFGRSPDQFGLLSAYDDVIEGRAEPHVWYDVLQEAGLWSPRIDLSESAEAPSLASPVPAPASPASAAPAAAPPPAPVPPTPAPPPAPVRPTSAPRPAPEPVKSARPAPQPPGPAMPRPTSEHDRQAFHVPTGVGRRQELVIQGDAVLWRGQTVVADEIEHLAYTAGDVLEVQLWGDGTELRIRMNGGRHRDAAVPAWQALVRWTETRVEGRLVDRYLDRLREKGRISVGDHVVTRNGVVVKGRVIPWEVLHSVEFDGRVVVINQRTEPTDDFTTVSTVDAQQPDVVLLPTIVAAASAATATGSPG